MRNSCFNCPRAAACLLPNLPKNTNNLFDTLQFPAKTLKRGEHLCHQGQLSDNLYIVRAGCLKSYINKTNGEEFVMGFYFPPDLFGWEGIDDAQRATSIVALDQTNICIIPTEKMLALTQQFPSLGAQLLKMVSRRIHEDNIALLRTTAEQRVTTFLLQLMERYQSLGLYSSTLSLVMTHQDIANYLRMTASTISRILNEFQKKKMIRFSKHRIELQKIDALRLIAEAGDTEAI